MTCTRYGTAYLAAAHGSVLGDPQERFANRQRIRTGIGYRRNLHWRLEALYIWTRSRDTTDQDFATSDNIVNLRVKRVF